MANKNKLHSLKINKRDAYKIWAIVCNTMPFKISHRIKVDLYRMFGDSDAHKFRKEIGEVVVNKYTYYKNNNIINK